MDAMLVDDTQFQAALAEYLTNTSKDIEVALNGKMRDIMFMATKFTPMMAAGGVTARGIDDVRALAVYRRRRQFNMPPYGKQPARPWPFTTADVTNSMAKIKHPSRGYMKSGFAKAGKQFAKNIASIINPPEGSPYYDAKHSGTKADVIRAAAGRFMAEVHAMWTGRDGADAAAKQAIVDDPLQAAVVYVYTDMILYLERKFSENAKAVSAA